MTRFYIGEWRFLDAHQTETLHTHTEREIIQEISREKRLEKDPIIRAQLGVYEAFGLVALWNEASTIEDLSAKYWITCFED